MGVRFGLGGLVVTSVGGAAVLIRKIWEVRRGAVDILVTRKAVRGGDQHEIVVSVWRGGVGALDSRGRCVGCVGDGVDGVPSSSWG